MSADFTGYDEIKARHTGSSNGHANDEKPRSGSLYVFATVRVARPNDVAD